MSWLEPGGITPRTFYVSPYAAERERGGGAMKAPMLVTLVLGLANADSSATLSSKLLKMAATKEAYAARQIQKLSQPVVSTKAVQGAAVGAIRKAGAIRTLAIVPSTTVAAPTVVAPPVITPAAAAASSASANPIAAAAAQAGAAARTVAATVPKAISPAAVAVRGAVSIVSEAAVGSAGAAAGAAATVSKAVVGSVGAAAGAVGGAAGVVGSAVGAVSEAAVGSVGAMAGVSASIVQTILGSAGAVATRAGAAVRAVALGSARVSVAVLQRVPVIVATGSAIVAAQWVAVRAFQLVLNGRRLRQANFDDAQTVELRSSRGDVSCLLAEPLRYGSCRKTQWKLSGRWLEWGTTRIVLKRPAEAQSASVCLDAACIRCAGRDGAGNFAPTLCAPQFLSPRLEQVVVVERAEKIADCPLGAMLYGLGMLAFTMVLFISRPQKSQKALNSPPRSPVKAPFVAARTPSASALLPPSTKQVTASPSSAFPSTPTTPYALTTPMTSPTKDTQSSSGDAGMPRVPSEALLRARRSNTSRELDLNDGLSA